MISSVMLSLFVAAQASATEVQLVENMLAAALQRDARAHIVTSPRACASKPCLLEVAAETGADLIVYGDVQKIGRRVVVTVHLFDVDDGAAAAQVVSRRRTAEALRKDVDALAASLLDEYFAERPSALRPRLVVLPLEPTPLPEGDGDGPPLLGLGLTAGGAVGLVAGGSALALSLAQAGPLGGPDEGRVARDVGGVVGVIIAGASAVSLGFGAYFLLGAGE